MNGLIFSTSIIVLSFLLSGCDPTDQTEMTISNDSTLTALNDAPNTPTEAESYQPVPTPKLGILGKKAPRLGVEKWFNLPDGKDSFDISELRGKVVYLYGFQSWCPGCHRYGFPTLNKLIDHYENNDEVAFVAVQTVFEGFGTNTVEAAKSTANRYALTIPVGHSGSPAKRSAVMQRYRTGGTPWTVVIGRDGVVQYNDFHIQPRQAIALIDRLLKK